MSPSISLEAEEMYRFSVSQPVRLVGQYQHALGAGCITIAIDLRVGLAVQEQPAGFELRLAGGAFQQQELLPDYAERWRRALDAEVLDEPAAVEGLAVEVDFRRLGDFCPGEVLLTSPALAAGLAAAAAAHRGRGAVATDVEVADRAAEALAAVTGEVRGQRFFPDILLSVAGGAAYVEPTGERINVQQPLPPESFLLALAPGMEFSNGVAECEEQLRRALLKVAEASGELVGERAMEAVFGLNGDVLEEDDTTKLYGLVRVRQMLDGFLEHLGEPYVDNDRLAEICDEERALLRDYFEFNADTYGEMCRRAEEAGALGAACTWAFGSYPAVVITAPGRRKQVQGALQDQFSDAIFHPIDIEPTGLLRGRDEAQGPDVGPPR
ncbi:MAG: hypothetical protein ACOC7T_02900 [Planctomycetota bacterium]